MLGSLGLDFDVIVARVDEDGTLDADPGHLVLANARLKAKWVSERHPERAVLGADTTVCLDGRIFNKPVDLDDARRMLARLSGRTHTVFTGLALVRRDPLMNESLLVASEVRFRHLDGAAIEDYITSVNTLDKAGAYAIQECGERIVQSHTGSLSNIIGLPLDETKALLTRLRLMA